MDINNTQQNSPYKKHTFVLKAFKNSQLIKYPKLTELYFNPTSHDYLDPQTFTKLCQDLKTLKSLNVLYLNFSYTKDLNNKSLSELSLALRQLHGLTILSLNFRENDDISGKGIAKILRTVKKKRFLSELYLDFSGCGRVSKKHLESIYDSISKMKLLTKFHLNHFDLWMQRAEVFEFAENLFKLKRLNYMKDFSMNFNPFPGQIFFH